MARLLFLICSLPLFLSSCQSPQAVTEVLPQYVFKAAPQLMVSIEKAKDQALIKDKLLLLVLGAQWCHDSTGLAKNFSTAKMQTILQERFETLFIDVGYFEDQHNIVQKFGYPAYFGTPTVLVIDPKTDRLLNQNTIPKWQSADSISMEEYLTYFNTVGLNAPPPQINNPQLVLFIQKQVQRLRQGFDYLRPIWKDVLSEKNNDTALLSSVAEEVWHFRVTLQKDIHNLYKQAAKIDGADLIYPVYDKMSWE
jgi:hypothetical protein